MNVSIFAANTYKQFKEELEKLEKDKIDSLIIDLRGNGGGHLSSVTNMISLFLDSSHVIYQTQTKKETEKTYSTGNVTKKYKIVLLCDDQSASASEVMMGALKDEYKATIIGTTSFGKGTVQELLTLPSDTQYKLTTKKWLTPNGTWVNGIGIKPDIEIKLSDEYIKNPSKENDNQLQEAIKYLSK
jgi:carboxyl-terminal processing protease